jgi:FkbM family methyltransferase
MNPDGRSLRRISYAQNGEDILLDRLFGDRPGSFMDVGAHHPIMDNNTFFFYERGWRGVNIEPMPDFHQLLREQRPGDLNLAVAVSDSAGTLPFYTVPQCSGLSTLSSAIAAEYRKRGWRVVESQMVVRSLGDLIRHHGIQPPDILSIDVENHEGKVIAGIPLESWRPGVMVVEATWPLSRVSSHQEWEPLLLHQGYLFAAFNGVNRFYLRGDRVDWLEKLRTPVNVLDGYERVETVVLRRQVADLQGQLQGLQAERARSQGVAPPS